jgi:hypothetical protein
MISLPFRAAGRDYNERLGSRTPREVHRRRTGAAAKAMHFTHNAEANQYLKPVFRKGWELKV